VRHERTWSVSLMSEVRFRRGGASLGALRVQGLRVSPRAGASLRYSIKRTFANCKIRRLELAEALFRGMLNHKKNEEAN
jgi:hypothetical protein